MNLSFSIAILLVQIVFSLSIQGQQLKVPKIYSNIVSNENGVFLDLNGVNIRAVPEVVKYKLSNFATVQGTPKGLKFDFLSPTMIGVLYYGFIPQNDSKFPQPVFMGKTAPIRGGIAEVYIRDMGGNFDMIGWMESTRGTLGYRVVDARMNIVYDGKINFDATNYLKTYDAYAEGAYGQKSPIPTEPFRVTNSITEGPLLANLTDNSVTITMKTNVKMKVFVKVKNKKFKSGGTKQHEIKITDLEPDTDYSYTIGYGNFSEEYSFHTAPAPGSRTKFTFSYASDSRSGNGGGERNLGGTNAFIMKRIMALNHQYNARFMQFTGDLVTGYSLDPESIRLEYSNWKQAVSPYARYIPVVVTMGNHEAVIKSFYDDQLKVFYQIDNFPFDQYSSEAIFQQEFVNPLNGPDSEDGSAYDPDPDQVDFPSYKESVFYYTYDNVAMVVLNSNYWYAPTHTQVKVTGGNIHGYIMDNQMEWMKVTLGKLDEDPNIDHVFVTIHTPFFPNGGHLTDDMWYEENNEFRPVVAGKPVAKGIIERRDELLDIIVNQTKKTKAILTGDEHNYARTLLNSKTKMYNFFKGPRITLNREIWQINNGAAGAPYYSQEKTPWTKSVSGFTTQNALVFFHVDGKDISVEVYNPDTLEKFDEFELN